MTKEKMYYIAYEICNYMRNNEVQSEFEDYEFCMYVAELAEDIRLAVRNNDGSGLEQYYKALENEKENVYETNDYMEIVRLINLLDEWKEN